MKVRKLIGGLAAAAMLLGGLTAGAFGAQAADDPVTTGGINVNNSQTGHKYTALLFATLDNPKVTDGQLTSLDINTSSGWRDGLIVGGYADTIREAAEKANGGVLSDQYTKNPAAAVATFDQTKLRAFADALTTELASKADQYTPSVEGNGSTAHIDAPQGWYLVTDTADGSTAQAGTSAIVATPIKVNGTTYVTIPVTSEDSTQTGIDASGEFNSKQQGGGETGLPKPVTTSDRDDTPVISYGSSPTYTTTAKIDGLKGDLYLRITTSKGVKVPNGEIGYQVFNDENGNGKFDSGESQLNRGSDYTLDSQTGDYAAGIVTIIKLLGLDGSIVNLGVTYVANVGAGAENHVFTNTPALSSDKTTWVEGNVHTLRTVDITFQKIGVDADADGLNGAAFAIRKTNDSDCVTVGANGTKMCYLKFGQTTQWDPDGWSLAEKPTYTVTSSTVDGKKGVVSFAGLGAGAYTIEEITQPDGYLSQFKPKFNVTIAADGKITFEPTSESLGFVTANSDKTSVTVKNVKAILQLPLTGSIGGAALGVVGVLALAGIVVLRVKSRKDAYAA